VNDATPPAPDRQLTLDDLRGMKPLRRVAELLSFLHDAGCDRDRAGNRQLHYDDYVLLVLLYLFKAADRLDAHAAEGGRPAGGA